MTEALHSKEALMLGLNSGLFVECNYAYQTSQLSYLALLFVGL
ncbi:hypothetical protein THF5H11_10060 [Vibrio jasicida]|uniref:DUF3265 domain-containing protein n=1 Tax=Vibrio jasicida TaxID=766224 RepID=A0AAU9QJ71_9VIBR|nr:hypothetical protein THF5H11_10060 [Vibrio jasicida]CAH1567368.1 hypothetical protein THF1C08_150059 [Vibrio jasicida]CAH1578221.1 hypothetical protein THF1A12_150062 [Vibrio jasicida]CAH1607247.1 hypothetical protein THF5G08_40007 [Vibrio jasicida]